MKIQISKTLISFAVIVSSTTLGLGLSNVANAASKTAVTRPPQTTEAIAPVVANDPMMLSMSQFNTRQTLVPQLAGVQAGDQIILSDDGTVTNHIWSGTYIFHPAGSVVPWGSMYARWKDGVVAITVTPADVATNVSPGTLDASFVQQNLDLNGFSASQEQTIRTLIADPTDSSVLRIPNNAWLFRVGNDGQLTALVDVFTFQSGSTPIQDNLTVSGTLPTATGSQPVPVSSSYISAN